MNIKAEQYNPSINNMNFKALPKKYSKIDEYLIRGPHPSVRNLIKLKKEGVNQIYDFRHYSNFGTKFVEKIACKVLGIKYKREAYSNLYGEYPSLDTFERISKDVKQNGERGGKTLFHCNSGRHRTSHMTAFYKITKGEPLKDVIKKQKEDYNQLVNDTIQTEVLDKDYYSRKINKYKGLNPIKLIIARINNKYAIGLHNGHKSFLEMMINKK